MFLRKPYQKKRQLGELGQFGLESLLPVLTSAINVGGQIGSALIQTKGAKEIAEMQTQTAASTAAVQERIAKLQLQALQQSAVAATPTTTPTTTMVTSTGEVVTVPVQQASLLASLTSSSLFGIPILYLAAGGALLFFLTRKKGEEN